jgi:hypothetical protein
MAEHWYQSTDRVLRLLRLLAQQLRCKQRCRVRCRVEPHGVRAAHISTRPGAAIHDLPSPTDSDVSVFLCVDGSDNRLGKFLFQIIEATRGGMPARDGNRSPRVMGRGDLEPKTSSYVRRPPFAERRVTRIR